MEYLREFGLLGEENFRDYNPGFSKYYSGHARNATLSTYFQNVVEFGRGVLGFDDALAYMDSFFDALELYTEIHAEMFGAYEGELVRQRKKLNKSSSDMNW